MGKRLLLIALTVKIFVLAIFATPIMFALYHIRRFGRDNPKDKPTNPFYE